MDEHDVVVEYKQVHNQQPQVNDECQEEAHKPRVCIPLAIEEVELEKVSLPVLGGEVDHSNQEEVKYCSKTVPGYEFTKWHWKAVDVFLRYVADQDKKKEY